MIPGDKQKLTPTEVTVEKVDSVSPEEVKDDVEVEIFGPPEVSLLIRLWRSFKRIGALLGLVLPIAFAAAGIQYLIHSVAHWASAEQQINDPTSEQALNAGLIVGVSFIFLFLVTMLTPIVWRRVRKPRYSRLIALLAVQSYAIGVGLLATEQKASWFVTFLLSSFGTIGWYAWRRRWRGHGIALHL